MIKRVLEECEELLLNVYTSLSTKINAKMRVGEVIDEIFINDINEILLELLKKHANIIEEKLRSIMILIDLLPVSNAVKNNKNNKNKEKSNNKTKNSQKRLPKYSNNTNNWPHQQLVHTLKMPADVKGYVMERRQFMHVY